MCNTLATGQSTGMPATDLTHAALILLMHDLCCCHDRMQNSCTCKSFTRMCLSCKGQLISLWEYHLTDDIALHRKLLMNSQTQTTRLGLHDSLLVTTHTSRILSACTSCLCDTGTLLNMLGLILIACSKEGGFNGLPAGAVILGLGGITYHLAQFHISNLFPGKRGLISSLYVAGFTGCGIIFYILYEIYNDLGGST